VPSRKMPWSSTNRIFIVVREKVLFAVTCSRSAKSIMREFLARAFGKGGDCAMWIGFPQGNRPESQYPQGFSRQ
jgi:hypothetical protein